MWRTSPKRDRERGVSLVEFLVYITLVVLILVVSAQVLFSMRRSATRVELASEARQTSRQAVEYVSRFVRGATDMNNINNANNPFAILVWYRQGNTTVQSSYNNVTNQSLADVGTDILTVAHPVSSLALGCDKWPGFLHASTAWWAYTEGCPDDAANMQMFKEVTGAHMEGNKELSAPMMVVGANGGAGFYQITGYQQSDCAGGKIHVVANPGLSDQLNPPGGQPTLTEPVTMLTGPRYVTFRVKDGSLQQKNGVFDPSNPDDGFVEVLPDMVDLQFAWLFADGTIWNNTGSHQLPTGTYTGSVPSQQGNGGGTVQTYDAINVVGIRVTATARASEPVTWEDEARFLRPAAEDRAAATQRDRLYYRRFSSIAMLRNRAPGM